MLNGFGYTVRTDFTAVRVSCFILDFQMFNIPSRDLETTWRDVSDLQHSDASPSAAEVDKINAEAALVSREISSRRFAKTRLYTGGRILHIIRRKKTEMEK